MDFLSGGLPGGGLSGSGMSFTQIAEQNEGFGLPRALVELGGKPFADKGKTAVISSVRVELSSGFEASVAHFRIYNGYDSSAGQYRYDDLKNNLLLGTPLTISLGYGGSVAVVFVGFIAEVYFGMEEAALPYIEVVGMDAKGIMMAGCYSTQLQAQSYGEAVREVLQRTNYEKLRSTGGIVDIQVTDTPDKMQRNDEERVEMVAESDYEFIVKAAKKFNFEFYVEKGVIYFRKAKEGADVLMTLGVGRGIRDFEIGYGITGLVETVEARAVNPGTGKLITAKKKLSSTISSGSKAKALLAKSQRVYIDPTITSADQAKARVDSIMEEMSFRLGSLDATCVGIPELLPGHYISVDGLGTPVANEFYLTSVVHDMDEHSGYFTRITGKTAEVKK